jgi:hypothetical protein
MPQERQTADRYQALSGIGDLPLGSRSYQAPRCVAAAG